MTMYTGYTQCPVCGYRYPVQTTTVTTGTSTKDEYVRVVLCKDCARNDNCFMYRESGNDDGFCAWAERREE